MTMLLNQPFGSDTFAVNVDTHIFEKQLVYDLLTETTNLSISEVNQFVSSYQTGCFDRAMDHILKRREILLPEMGTSLLLLRFLEACSAKVALKAVPNSLRTESFLRFYTNRGMCIDLRR